MGLLNIIVSIHNIGLKSDSRIQKPNDKRSLKESILCDWLKTHALQEPKARNHSILPSGPFFKDFKKSLFKRTKGRGKRDSR
jgi:hypothetical protein